ncbi:hypothetical protein PC113_g7952 [Phytophthora cactorum]|uniref:Uncharacterized protein n=1 Tax=Phytophthora cactorum TaxID=29920 RepID=A0A8T0ZCS3_9STRA|nr:hypothetical protein PC113_g7952 [Phytophthora cactorum]
MTSPPLAKTRQRLQILIAGALALVLWLCKLQTIACQSVAFNPARATFVTLCESIRQSLHRSHTGSESVKSPSECIAR